MIKVCGNKFNIKEVTQLRPDFMGFIYISSSQRFVNEERLLDEIKSIRNIKKVGVFADAEIQQVIAMVERCQLDFVQLHGEESSEYCNALLPHVKLIKAIKLKNESDVQKVYAYTNCIQFALFDSAQGGSGLKFDHRWLKTYCGHIPFFVAGGISPHDHNEVESLMQLPYFVGLDLNSKFEVSPGYKNISILKTFINNINL